MENSFEWLSDRFAWTLALAALAVFIYFLFGEAVHRRRDGEQVPFVSRTLLLTMLLFFAAYMALSLIVGANPFWEYAPWLFPSTAAASLAVAWAGPVLCAYIQRLRYEAG